MRYINLHLNLHLQLNQNNQKTECIETQTVNTQKMALITAQMNTHKKPTLTETEPGLVACYQ